MIPNIDSNPAMKPFKDVSGIFVTVYFDGRYLTWIKIPEVFDAKTNRNCNAYCFEQERLDYFDSSYYVADPKSANIKVEF